MTPPPIPPPFPAQAAEPPPPPPPPPLPKRTWKEKLSGVAWIVLCFELGAFLVVYPWMDGWDRNGLANWREGWNHIWISPWFRGAVSGVGAVNLIIALVELYRYLRFMLID